MENHLCAQRDDNNAMQSFVLRASSSESMRSVAGIGGRRLFVQTFDLQIQTRNQHTMSNWKREWFLQIYFEMQDKTSVIYNGKL